MDYETMIQEQLSDLDLAELEQIMKDAAATSNGIFDVLSTEDIVSSFVHGEPLFHAETILNNILDVLFLEVKSGVVLGVQIISICIIMGLLGNLSTSFGSKAASHLGNIVCSCMIIMLCLNNFRETYASCQDTLAIMTNTMQILLPILIPLLISIGGFSSGSILDPVIAGSVTGFNTIFQNIILPVLFVASTLVLVNSLTEKPYVGRLAVFLRKAALYGTGLTVTIFTGIASIQGIMTKSADGLLVNTARYSVSNFVPIVGKFASDSIDMVLSCAGVIKNGIGLLGILIILCLLCVPVLKMVSVALIYKLTAILSESISTKQISETLNEMGNAVIAMTVILGMGALMFLLFLTIIIGIGGGTLWK